ncbi:MAG: tetratricopeptide repeat protein [Candidatus Kapabacteria bacterium]|nr:tetratricopeptide repeat protein [Candidatus Kapabacteria bacterium]
MQKYVYILIVFLIINLQAQSTFDQKLQLADSYESNGDYESACRLYKEIFQTNQKNPSVLEGLVRNYKKVNKQAELLLIVKDYASKNQTVANSNLLGELYWKVGNSKEANLYWQTAITLSKDDFKSYLLISNTQSQLLLFDKAIATLKEFRTINDSPQSFSDELSKLYIANGNYKDGIIEVFQLLKINKNIALAQGRVYAMMTSKEAKDYIFKSLETEAQINDKTLYLQELFAWYLRTMNRLSDALEVYRRIDNLRRANGYDIYQFAEISRKDEQFEIAFKAYEIIIDNGKKNPFFTQALYGFAQSFESKYANGSIIPKDRVNEIIERYKNVISEEPNSVIALECNYRLAQIYLKQLNDKNTSLVYLNKLIKSPNSNIAVVNAFFLLGEIYFSEGKIEESKNQFKSIINRMGNQFPDKNDLAKYRLAEIDYFLGKIDTAKAQFLEISKNVNSNLANDAMNKIIVIQASRKDSIGINQFSKAEMLKFQRDYTNAINIFKEIKERKQDFELNEFATFELIKTYYDMEKFDESILLIDELLNKYPDTNNGDIALFYKGNCQMKQLKKELAIETFTLFLNKYPVSIYLQEARNKIRKLRDGI